MNYRKLAIILTTIIMLSSVILLAKVSAWSNTTFNNSLTTENLTMANKTIQTKYLAIPSSIVTITNAYANLSGKNADYFMTSGASRFTAPADKIRFGDKTRICGRIANVTMYLGKYSAGEYIYSNFNITIRKQSDDSAYVNTYWGNGTNLSATSNTLFVSFPEQYICDDVYVLIEMTNTTMVYPHVPTLFYEKETFASYNQPSSELGLTCAERTIFLGVGYNGSDYLRTQDAGQTIGCLHGLIVGYNYTNFTYNPNMSVINNNIWNFSTSFNSSYTNNRTINFASLLSRYLNSTYLSGSNYVIPFNFMTITSGEMIYSDLWFSNEGLLENSQTYNTTTYETASETFILNVSYDTTLYPSTPIGTFNYNGTSYVVTPTISGTNAIFSKAVIIPLITGTTNTSFFWNITMTNSSGSITYYTSILKNQTILDLPSINITSLSCASGFSPAFYFDFKNEETLSAVQGNVSYNVQYGLEGNTTGIVANGSLTNVNNFTICINNTATNYSVGYGEIQYSGTGYTPRRWYIFENTRMTSTLVSNTLYMLPTTSTTTFAVTTQDNLFNPTTNAYLGLLRWYPSLNEYKIVDMGKTDDLGQTILNIQTESVDYRVAVYYLNGSLIVLKEPVRFICEAVPCEYSIFLPTTTSTLYDIDSIQYSLTFNRTTKIFTFIWNDVSQATTMMNLTVYKDAFDTSTILCSTTSNSFTGVLTCDVSAYSGNIRAEVYRSASPTIPLYQLLVNLSNRLVDVTGGKTIGLFMTFIFVVFAFLVGIFNPVVAIVLGILAMIPALYVGSISGTVVIGFLILGMILIHFLRRS